MRKAVGEESGFDVDDETKKVYTWTGGDHVMG
jgi:hypothetical protein